jgi:hypothetical protein
MGVTERRGVLLGLRHVENVDCENTDRAERNDGWSHGTHTRTHPQRAAEYFSLPKDRYPKNGPGSASPFFTACWDSLGVGKSSGIRSDCHDSDLKMAVEVERRSLGAQSVTRWWQSAGDKAPYTLDQSG